MNAKERELLKAEIDRAKVVTFDIFDTLLFRKTNAPETVFDLIGKRFQIHGFRKLRTDARREANSRGNGGQAGIDAVYAVLSEHNEIPVDWNEVKQYEIQLAWDDLTANREMLEFFQYAKEQGKRVAAFGDGLLPAQILAQILEEKGFAGIDHVGCLSERASESFALLAQREQVTQGEILHVTGTAPDNCEVHTVVYRHGGELEKVQKAVGSDVDAGLYKILYDEQKGFWYNLGVEVGGPIYMGLYQFLAAKAREEGKKIYFLSRDGYNLYHIFREHGFENVEYLYTSRRALTLAAIREMDEQAVASLPPYVHGQTVGEILDYLCVDQSQITHLEDTGLKSFDQVIRSDEDIAAFKKLYHYDRDVFLRRCEQERENAVKYFRKIGFLEADAICFDCGWQGSSQALLERFKQAVGTDVKHTFVYFGIRNCDRSRKQLRGMRYDTYLFDFYKNFSLQIDLEENVVMYELFFSAPHEGVYYYGENGEPVLKEGTGDREKEDLLAGIADFVRTGLDFVRKYDVEYTPELAVGHLARLIHFPTEEEALRIGNLKDVGGFARGRREGEPIAWLTRKQLKSGQKVEVHWPDGLLKRPDVPEDVKTEYAARIGRLYPPVVSEYHLEAPRSIHRYHRWLNWQELHQEPKKELGYKPAFSFVIPVYNTVTEQLEECIQSVLNQEYDNFELILVDDHSSWENVRPVLRKYEARPNVRVIYRQTNGHISAATNDGIQAASGEFIVFMDCDDTIEPDALYEFAAKLNENPELDFIYSDEDKLTEDGKIRHMPFFKPDWSPDLFRNIMYTNHLATYRTSIVKKVGGLRTAYNGSQDYDFTLRFLEHSDNKRVGHVAKILYHWRERKESVAYAISSKTYAIEAARQAKEDCVRRNGLNATIEYVTGMAQYRILYGVEGTPLVSVIIPSKDHPDILKQCIDSLRAFTRHSNYEIVVVDNGSQEENRARIREYLSCVGATYVYEQEEFNFSKMCNRGARHAKGDYLLFLNDDIELFQPDWLERMLGHAQQKHTGAVGAKLFYPETTTLQHAGISNVDGEPQHNFLAHDDQITCYFGWNRIDRNCIAVTGACLLLAKEKFWEAGGFDEAFPVAYNDVKLCFALHEKGYYNVIRNDVFAYHHESLSRGSDLADAKKLLRLNAERRKLFEQFPHLEERDPYLNEHLRRWSLWLDLKHSYDKLEKLDLSGCLPLRHANIDAVQVGDEIRVDGWAFLWGEKNLKDLERYIVFRDPFGQACGVRALPWIRPDVVEYFGSAKYLYSGVECILRQSDLRVDLFSYQVGILLISRTGRRHLHWGGETPIVENRGARPAATGVRPIRQFAPCGTGADVAWSLDVCRPVEAGYELSGYAFKQGGDHYLYTNSLVLYDDAGNGFEVEVQPERRVDVACAFPKEHFLWDVGFSCGLVEGMLRRGVRYNVVIRLTHRFDPDDVRDVLTNQIVEMP